MNACSSRSCRQDGWLLHWDRRDNLHVTGVLQLTACRTLLCCRDSGCRERANQMLMWTLHRNLGTLGWVAGFRGSCWTLSQDLKLVRFWLHTVEDAGPRPGPGLLYDKALNSASKKSASTLMSTPPPCLFVIDRGADEWAAGEKPLLPARTEDTQRY